MAAGVLDFCPLHTKLSQVSISAIDGSMLPQDKEGPATLAEHLVQD